MTRPRYESYLVRRCSGWREGGTRGAKRQIKEGLGQEKRRPSSFPGDRTCLEW